MRLDEIQVMVDLETMSSQWNASIVSIGAVAFTLRDGVLEDKLKFYATVDIKSNEKYGLHFDGGTIAWWLNQSDKARAALLQTPEALDRVLARFDNWYPNGAPLWGNGATFDNVILRNAYNVVGFKPPWHYRDDRCFRTMARMLKEVPYTRAGEHHNALDDAITQANYLSAAWAATYPETK